MLISFIDHDLPTTTLAPGSFQTARGYLDGPRPRGTLAWTRLSQLRQDLLVEGELPGVPPITLIVWCKCCLILGPLFEKTCHGYSIAFIAVTL